MESPIMDDDKEHDNKEKSSKCPKCLSGDMVEHPSYLSMPLLLVQKLLKNQRQPLKIKMQILSLDLFHVENAGYSELYVGVSLLESGYDFSN